MACTIMLISSQGTVGSCARTHDSRGDKEGGGGSDMCVSDDDDDCDLDVSDDL